MCVALEVQLGCVVRGASAPHSVWHTSEGVVEETPSSSTAPPRRRTPRVASRRRHRRSQGCLHRTSRVAVDSSPQHRGCCSVATRTSVASRIRRAVMPASTRARSAVRAAVPVGPFRLACRRPDLRSRVGRTVSRSPNTMWSDRTSPGPTPALSCDVLCAGQEDVRYRDPRRRTNARASRAEASTRTRSQPLPVTRGSPGLRRSASGPTSRCSWEARDLGHRHRAARPPSGSDSGITQLEFATGQTFTSTPTSRSTRTTSSTSDCSLAGDATVDPDGSRSHRRRAVHR